MDADRFDAIARRLGARATRRDALGWLIGIGAELAGAAPAFGAGKNRSGKKGQKRRDKRRRPRTQGKCANPGPSRNLNGCDFSGRDFSGNDLSGSEINDATFDNAELIGADLSDSSMRRTSFRGANLCRATLTSAALNKTDFRGGAGPNGRPTNLIGADLRGSGCGGVQFDTSTIFCGTRMCNGVIRNDDCPAGVDPEDTCCADADCGFGRICRNGACLPDPGTCTAGQNLCRTGSSRCGDKPGCRCFVTTDSESFCGLGMTCSDCSSDEDCAAVSGPGSVCADVTGNLCGCRETHKRACVAPCGATCTTNAECGDFGVCCDGQCQRGDCCTTADCAPNETCEENICTCQGCIGRINSECKPGTAWAECGTDTRCAECHRDEVCAANQTCVGCEFGGVGGTWCDVVDDFARFQCGRNCACATNPQGFGACFNTAVPGYCHIGQDREPICEFAADCIIEGYGDYCILAGECEPGCNRTVCVTRCGAGEGSGDGPLQVVGVA